MRLIRRKMFVLLALVFTAALFTFSAVSPSPLQASVLSAGNEQREVQRIHAHFDSVTIELTMRNVSHLTKRQYANRRALIETLRAYNEREVFPHNYDFRSPTPYFIDRKTAALCAVAFLLESTGRRDIVDRVAQTDNNVWVAHLNNDTAFVSWLNASGITLSEAARIQVPYTASQESVVMYTAGVLSVPVLAGTAVGFATWNLIGNADGHSQKGQYLGLTSGVLAAGIGAGVALQSGPPKSIRVLSAVGSAVGVVTAGIATRALVGRGDMLAQKRDSEHAKRANIETNISPIFPIGKDGRTGLSMSIRF